MTITIRAVVENGTLRPLEPVDLVEGQEGSFCLVYSYK